MLRPRRLAVLAALAVCGAPGRSTGPGFMEPAAHRKPKANASGERWMPAPRVLGQPKAPRPQNILCAS
jgi:hypothetical protein